MRTFNKDNSLTTTGIIRSVLVAFGVAAILFGLFEVIENVWLRDVDMDVLHFLYVLRGLVISLVAVVLVGWLIVRASDPLLISRKWESEYRSIREERLANFNSWFIFMRWIAILIAIVLSYMVIQVNEWLPKTLWWPLIITIGFLAVLNLAYMLVYRYGNVNSYLLPFQTYADLFILIILLHFSGGIENPLILMIVIHVIIAGIILNRRHLFAVTATAIGLLLFMAVGEATGFLPHYTLNIFPHFEQHGTHIHAAHQPIYVVSVVGMLIAISLLTAYFISSVMSRIRSDEQQLERLADQSREQRQLIEKSLATTETGLCVCDNNGNPFWTNQIWDSWFGNCSVDRIDASSKTGNSGDMMKTLNDGKTRAGEITIDAGDSEMPSSRTFQVTTAPLVDKEGNIDHTVSLARDITNQKKAQEQMLRAGKLAAVGELAGKVAHEVNNPIGIISAKCRILLSDHKDEMSNKISEELVKITDAADRVSDIAKGLLSYCRPSPATRTDIDIHSSIQHAISMIDQSAGRKGVEIDNQIPGNLPPVTANPDEMQQVFINLFMNALDAMPDGGRLEITASVSENDAKAGSRDFLTVNIKDNGTGIPPHIQEQIYEPFFTTKGEGKGTGLGLSICSGLIRSHGGTIDISSTPGEGTRVTIQLPLNGKNQGGDFHD